MNHWDEYREMAWNFCFDTKTEIYINRRGIVDRFPDENKRTGSRFCYDVTFRRNGKEYKTIFYDSLYNSNRNYTPGTYDVLSYLQKTDPGTFWDFISEFRYEINTEESFRNARKIYKNCAREYRAVKDLFSDVLERLQEIN